MRRRGLALVLGCVVTLCACASGQSGATPGPVGRSPVELPTEDGQVGVFMRGCLSPDSGLARGAGTAAVLDPARVTAVIQCTPDTTRQAVVVSRAEGDPRPLVTSLASTPTTVPGGKTVTYRVYLDDDTVETFTWGDAPASAVAAARFAVIGTTPPGSL
jgi:hypothetical protein